MNVPRDFGPSTQPTVSELDRDLLHGGARVGGCVIIEPLSQDDAGIVYVADDPVLRRRVLIREHYPLGLAARGPKGEVVLVSGTQAGVRASALEAFLRGARLLDSFDHPAIARVHRVWEEQGTAYLMSPFYDGSPLGAYLHRQSEPPGEAWLRALLVPLLGALETLHAAGVFHLGLSPESIWLTGDLKPVLIDLSSSVESGSVARAATDSVDRLYAPLELFSHGSAFPVGPWTDLYGIAAVLHHALLGRPPMSAAVLGPADEHAPLAEGLLRRIGARASSLPSASFLRAIDQALSVRPEHRPQSVAAFRQLMGLADAPHAAVPATDLHTTAAPQASPEPAVPPVAVPPAKPSVPQSAAVRPERATPRGPDAVVDDDKAALESPSEPEIDEAASAAIALAMSSLTWTDRREPVLPGMTPRPMPKPSAKAVPPAPSASGGPRPAAAGAGPMPGRPAQREPGFHGASATASAAASAGAVPSWVLPGPGKRRKPQAAKVARRGRHVQVFAGLLVGFAALSVAGWYAKDSPQVMAWVQPWLNEVGLRPTVAGPAVVTESPARESTSASQTAAPADPAALVAQQPTAAGPAPASTVDAAAAPAAPAVAPTPTPPHAAEAPVPPAAAEPAAVPPLARLTAKERAAARAAERAAARAAERAQAAERATARAGERASARAKAAERAAERSAARAAERAKTVEPARAAAEVAPATPRAACGTRSNFSLFRCMETQCNLGRYSRHPQCIQFRRDGDV